MRYKWLRLTEMVGGIVLRPYVPHGTKKIGEGEGDIMALHIIYNGAAYCHFYIIQ